MDRTGEGLGLSTAKIFATMELMVTLRLLIFFLGISIGFYFELMIIFDRICTILNIENKRMIKISEDTKQPLNLVPATNDRIANQKNTSDEASLEILLDVSTNPEDQRKIKSMS